MLCGVALHDELAELRAAVGPQVFDDPVTFRAAFDDFIPEGSASTGEVSLLVGAIATGALQRVKEQLALGADPEMTIAVQGDLLARDRGTSESNGARWALSALAHAVGAVSVQHVLTQPTSGPDSVDTAGRPPTPSRPGPVDPGPTRPIAGADATRVVGEEPPTARTEPGKRGINPVLIGVLAVLAVVAVTAVVLLLLRDNDSPTDAAEDSPSSERGTPDGDVLAQIEMTDAGTTVRLQLVVDGTDASIVLLADQDGEYVEVDRESVTCPFLDSSYDAGIEDEGDHQLYWGWQNEGNESFGEYGEVIIEEERLVKYPSGDLVCPDAR